MLNRFTIFLYLTLLTAFLPLKAQKNLSGNERLKQLVNEVKQLDRKLNNQAFQLANEGIPLATQLGDSISLITFLLTNGKVYWGKSNYDSARYFLNQAKRLATIKNDKQQLTQILNVLGQTFYAGTEGDSVLFYYNQALNLAEEVNFQEEKFFVLNNLGKFYKNTGNYSTAEPYFLQALNLQKKLGNKRYQAGILQNLGNNASSDNNLKKTIVYYLQSLAIMEELGDKKGESMVLSLIGYHYSEKAYFPTALDYYQKALIIADQENERTTKIQCLKGIGKIYESMGDHTKAMEYYHQILLDERQNGSEIGLANIFNNIGRNYLLRDQFDSANFFFFQALAAQKKVNNENIGQAQTLVNIGNSFAGLGNQDTAMVYFQKGLQQARAFKKKFVEIKALTGIGKILVEQNQLKKAIEIFKQANSQAKKAGFREIELEISSELYKSYKALNNNTQALIYHESYQTLKDSLFNIENTEKMIRIDTEAELEKERRELAFEQEREKERQRSFRQILYLSLAAACFIIFIIAWYYYQNQKANQKLSKLNQEINAQKDQLEELDELKSRFFTNISHEFRTPLTIIKGMSDQILENPAKWGVKGGKMIKRNSQQLLNLVNQILDLRKLESGQMELNWVKADILHFLNYLTESLHSLAGDKEITLSFHSPEEDLQMDFDSEKLMQVIINLLSNAIKFTPQNGEINVIANRKKDSNDMLEIRIKDTGIGIPESKLSNIFDRFYQVDGSITRENEGTGIGLSLTKELVKLMEGEISVSSKVNGGTEFLISLPIHQNAPEQEIRKTPLIGQKVTSSLEKAIDEPSPSPQIKTLPSLLIIEDNYDVVEYLRACLEDQYSLLIARDGQEGIETAFEHIPDLIITDVMMPRKDGFEVCQTVKLDQRTSHIPIVMLTAKADNESKIRGLKKGADAYLAKPFNKEELFIRLENLLKIRQNLQERYAKTEVHDLQPDPAFEQEDAFIKKIRETVEANLSDSDFSVSELCKLIGMSRTTLHRKITALTGSSTTLFIRKTRVQQAYRLLKETDLNFSEIGYAVGFGDPRYFNRSFTKIYGFPPREVREK